MADYRGIFSLQEFYEEQQSGNWAIAEESSFTKPPYSLPWNYGYVAGGTPSPGLTSIVQRMDMSNDLNVNSVRGPLTRAAYAHGGIISSDTHGYFLMGTNGYGGSYTTDIDRIDYSNDTIDAVPKGNLAVARVGSQSSNTSYGYNSGGFNGSTALSTVDRIDFSNDTANATPKGPLSAAKYRHTGVGNQDYGYAGAGNGAPVPPSPTRTYIDRIDYSNDSATALNRVDMGTYSDGQATGNADYGYFYKTTETLKYDYANDTTALTPVGVFGTAVYRAGGFSNSQYGYVANGSLIPGPSSSLTQRTDFSNDTGTLSTRGNCSRAGAYVKTTSNQSNGRSPFNTSIPADNQIGITTTGTTVNSKNKTVFSYNYGYHGGGYSSPPTVRRSSIDRIDYANDTTNLSPRTNFAVPTRQGATGLNSPFGFGYAARGYNGSGNTSNVDRIDFSNDTSLVSPGGNLSVIGSTSAPLIGNGFGYVCGGSTTGTPGYTSNIERLDFSNDTANLNSSLRMTEEKGFVGGTGTRNFGYIMGGFSQPGTRRLSTIERLDYSNDTAGSAVRATASEIIQDNQGLGSASHGYACGTYNGSSNTSKIYRIDYANDTAQASHRANILLGTTGHSTSTTRTYGYIAGGESPTRSNMQRFDYANDTATTISRGFMTEQRGDSFGVSSLTQLVPQPPAQINDLKGPLAVATPGQQYGYVAGGDYGPDVSTIERIDYANDTSGTSVRTPLPTATYGASFVGNAYYGYYGGGFTPGPTVRSTVERVDFSNDTSVGPAGPLSFARGFFGSMAAGNENYGWFGGGFSASSRVDRIDYSNDGATASPRGNLTAARYGMAATGNMDYGYWSGGNPGPVSYIDRIDYSNDTPTASPKGLLSQGRRYAAATGNANYGWIGGGNLPSPVTSYSIVDRIDYSNDTATASPRGPLSQARYQLTATGNKSYGYWFGGYYPSSYSTVDRVDFSNDTAIASARGHITQARYDLVSASAAANGLPQGS